MFFIFKYTIIYEIFYFGWYSFGQREGNSVGNLKKYGNSADSLKSVLSTSRISVENVRSHTFDDLTTRHYTNSWNKWVYSVANEWKN